MRCPVSARTIPLWARFTSVSIRKCGDQNPIRKPLPRLCKPCSASPWNPIPKPSPWAPRSTLLRVLSTPAMDADIAIARAPSSAACAAFPWEPRHRGRQIPHLPFTPYPLSTTRTCRNLHGPRGKLVMKFIRSPGLPRARITTITTIITTIFRAARAPKAFRVPTPPRVREKPTGSELPLPPKANP